MFAAGNIWGVVMTIRIHSGCGWMTISPGQAFRLGHMVWRKWWLIWHPIYFISSFSSCCSWRTSLKFIPWDQYWFLSLKISYVLYGEQEVPCMTRRIDLYNCMNTADHGGGCHGTGIAEAFAHCERKIRGKHLRNNLDPCFSCIFSLPSGVLLCCILVMIDDMVNNILTTSS